MEWRSSSFRLNSESPENYLLRKNIKLTTCITSRSYLSGYGPTSAIDAFLRKLIGLYFFFYIAKINYQKLFATNFNAVKQYCWYTEAQGAKLYVEHNSAHYEAVNSSEVSTSLNSLALWKHGTPVVQLIFIVHNRFFK